MKKLNVIVYPDPTTGKFPFVSAIEAQNQAEATIETHVNELSIAHTTTTEKPTLFVVDKAIMKQEKVELVFWNPIPESEIEKLLNYDLRDIEACGISLFSVYSKFNSADENKSSKKVGPLNDKEKFEKKWGHILSNKE